MPAADQLRAGRSLLAMLAGMMLSVCGDAVAQSRKLPQELERRPRPPVQKPAAPLTPVPKVPPATEPQIPIGNPATHSLAVDVVTLKSGKVFRGAILHRDKSSTVFLAVRRAWAKANLPEFYEQAVLAETAEQLAAWKQLRERLDQRVTHPVESKSLQFFLEEERDRAGKLLDNPQLTPKREFLIVELPANQIARIVSPSPEQLRIALWGWSEKLDAVETHSLAELQKELKSRNIDVTNSPPDLSGELPARRQSEREWQTRLALAEYTLHEPLDFQGTGDVLIPANANRDASSLVPILTRVLQDQMGGLFRELTDTKPANAGGAPKNREGTAWWSSASTQAESLRKTSFRATRVDVNVEQKQAIVQSAFVVQFDDGTWRAIWTTRQLQDGNIARGAEEDRIANDPQVKGALAAVRNFGFDHGDVIKQAIRFGAATMVAQQQVDARFREFRDAHLKHLDGPPLWLEDR